MNPRRRCLRLEQMGIIVINQGTFNTKTSTFNVLYMSTWRRIVITLFPEHTKGAFGFQRPEMTIWQIFFEFERLIDQFIEEDDEDSIARIFKFVNWCFSMRYRSPDLWGAAAAAFLEHLADTDERAKIIPKWVKPPVFKFMREEFEKRRERKGVGKFKELLDEYNRYNRTEFT